MLFVRRCEQRVDGRYMHEPRAVVAASRDDVACPFDIGLPGLGKFFPTDVDQRRRVYYGSATRNCAAEYVRATKIAFDDFDIQPIERRARSTRAAEDASAHAPLVELAHDAIAEQAGAAGNKYHFVAFANTVWEKI